MAKNVMSEVAQLLHVRLGERFKIKNYLGEYYLSEGGLYSVGNRDDYNGILMSLLRGTDEIIKKPWKPRLKERYYTISGMCNDDKDIVICQEIFTNGVYDYMNFAMHNCFQTKEEAELHKEEILKKLKETYKNG